MSDRGTPDGLYVYCVIRCDAPVRFATAGIGERADAVCSVSEGDLAAVVSASPIVKYEALRRNLMAHTLVLEEVMRDYTILPVRFGTIAADADLIRESLLAKRRDELVSLLEEMDGRLELGLKAFWPEDSVFQEIVGEDPAIRALRDRLMGRSADETHFERMKLGEMVEAAMKKKREQDADAILARVQPLAHHLKVNKAVGERMVVNVALLVDREREPEVDEAVRRLDGEMGGRLQLRYVGGVPPYNFVNVSVQW